MQIAYPLRPTPRQPWAPMTDAEWAVLAPVVCGRAAARAPEGGSAPRTQSEGEALLPRRGRPPEDPRRLWDAIFWVACSSGPWKELPPELGRADTAHRALRRHARNGVLDRLVFAVSPHPLGGDLLAPLAWRIQRAFRRVARLLTVAQLVMAKRLGLASALPCAPEHLPQPHLSETIARLAPLVRRGGPALFRHLIRLHKDLVGARHLWRTRD